MFALSALIVFSVLGVALYTVLEKELARYQTRELQTRFKLMGASIGKNSTAARWEGLQAKLDALSSSNKGVHYWVMGDDPRFRYGDAAVLGAMKDTGAGFGTLTLPGETHPVVTLSGEIAANGERPQVRFVAAVASERFHETLRAFALALVALCFFGVAAVALIGHWIARVGLRPVDRLSREAQRLSPDNLAQRLRISPLPRELSDLAHSFNGALDRLETAYSQLEAFNADVAHELRTPLTNLIGQTQVALSRPRSVEDFEEVLQSNLEELERLRALINDMLFLARADRGAVAGDRAAASLAEEVAKTVEFLEFILDEAEVGVRIHGSATAPIDTSLFRRAMTNLLHNAVKHAQPGDSIEVDLREGDDMVRVSVLNQGEAIADEHLPRIFDRFYRIDSARRDSRDSHGLGLSIVKAVASMHGGDVFASCRDGTTTIGFSLARRSVT